jgi:drug/metabolite transporter (DMT)-like permease
MEKSETKLDKPLGGLFLMTIFTVIWTLLAEYFFRAADYYLAGIFFGIVVIYFIFAYFSLNKGKREMPKIVELKNPQKEKWYWIIVALEGIAIFVTNVVLTNIGRDELFISCFVLIVGLHFIPLAKVFERKFDYYIGIWTILIASLGIIFTLQHIFNQNIINAFVCLGCATSTALYGTKMITDANKIFQGVKA